MLLKVLVMLTAIVVMTALGAVALTIVTNNWPLKTAKRRFLLFFVGILVVSGVLYVGKFVGRLPIEDQDVQEQISRLWPYGEPIYSYVGYEVEKDPYSQRYELLFDGKGGDFRETYMVIRCDALPFWLGTYCQHAGWQYTGPPLPSYREGFPKQN